MNFNNRNVTHTAEYGHVTNHVLYLQFARSLKVHFILFRYYLYSLQSLDVILRHSIATHFPKAEIGPCLLPHLFILSNIQAKGHIFFVFRLVFFFTNCE